MMVLVPAGEFMMGARDADLLIVGAGGPPKLAGGDEQPHVPRCIKGQMPCRGCFGPIRKGANPMVDMMGAISSIGLNAQEISDRAATFNRYVGAHGKLRPLPKRI